MVFTGLWDGPNTSAKCTNQIEIPIKCFDNRIIQGEIAITLGLRRLCNSVSSVAQSCPTLCDPMNRSMPGLPVHHRFPESTQTHVPWVGDAIQPSHPLSSTSSPALNLSQHQGLFKWVSSAWCGQSVWVSASTSVLPMNTQDWSPLGLTDWISLLSEWRSRVLSNTTVQKHQFFGPQLSL